MFDAMIIILSVLSLALGVFLVKKLTSSDNLDNQYRNAFVTLTITAAALLFAVYLSFKQVTMPYFLWLTTLTTDKGLVGFMYLISLSFIGAFMMLLAELDLKDLVKNKRF